MNRDHASKDRLDHAIDHVAARLVHVADDADMAHRIAGALPERSRLGWLIPQLAALTALAIAAIVWTTRPSPPPVVAQLPSSYATRLVALSRTVTANEPGTAPRTVPVEPVERLELLEPLDHERSLPLLETINSLTMRDVSPIELPSTPALVLAPLEIADLPLTADVISSRW